MLLDRLYKSLSARLQIVAIFLSFVGVGFGLKSYLHIKEIFGEQASQLFWDDFKLQILIAILANAFVTVVIYQIATKPIKRLGDVMRDITENKLDVEVPYTTQATEIGGMARAVEIFKRNGIEKLELEKRQAEAELRAEEERRKAMEKMADTFEGKVQSIIGQVFEASKELYATAESLVQLMTNMRNRSSSAEAASGNTMGKIENVASAAEDMLVSIREISGQVNKSTSVVNETVDKTDASDTSTQKLVEVSNEIGDVLQMIHEIAGQINLLALNATIESARAGEAGKGFAVVASEVKNLAGQTSKATEEISSKINNTQEVSNDVARALSEIKQLVSAVNEYAASISNAIEQQSTTTSNIAHNVQVAAESSRQIAENVRNVSSDADEATKGANQVLAAAKSLTEQGEELQRQVQEFLSGVREDTTQSEERLALVA